MKQTVVFGFHTGFSDSERKIITRCGVSSKIIK